MGFRLVYWDQWFSTWAILSPEVHGTMYVETFVIVRTGRRQERHDVTGIWLVEARDATACGRAPQRIIWPQTIVSWLRNPHLDAHYVNSLSTAFL